MVLISAGPRRQRQRPSLSDQQAGQANLGLAAAAGEIGLDRGRVQQTTSETGDQTAISRTRGRLPDLTSDVGSKSVAVSSTTRPRDPGAYHRAELAFRQPSGGSSRPGPWFALRRRRRIEDRLGAGHDRSSAVHGRLTSHDHQFRYGHTSNKPTRSKSGRRSESQKLRVPSLARTQDRNMTRTTWLSPVLIHVLTIISLFFQVVLLLISPLYSWALSRPSPPSSHTFHRAHI